MAGDLRPDTVALGAGVCSFAKAVVGLAQGQPDSALVLTTTCDQMRRSFDAFEAAGRERVFLLGVPATWQSASARLLYASELRRLGRFLEGLGGVAPSSKALLQQIKTHAAARQQLLAAAPANSSRQYANAVARFHWDASLAPLSKLPLNDDIPLALVGGPMSASQWDLFDLIESSGGRVVLNATEAGERSLWPEFSFADPEADPFELLVDGYFDHSMDVFQRPNTRLYAWLKKQIKVRGVRGLVLWHHTGCDLWRAEASTLRETFGLNVLSLEAGDAPGVTPRHAARVQAFLETLND